MLKNVPHEWEENKEFRQVRKTGWTKLVVKIHVDW
jgi:hypothetical protein